MLVVWTTAGGAMLTISLLCAPRNRPARVPMTVKMDIDKDTLRLQLIEQLERQRQNALLAADNAHDAATHEESVAETQYDTVGLEAAYLAHGQSQRVADCEQAILRLQSLVWDAEKEDEDEVDIGSIITLIRPNGDNKPNHTQNSSKAEKSCSEKPANLQWYWMLPVAGGLKVQCDELCITVITPQSPLGESVLGAWLEETLDNGMQIERII